MSALAGSAPGAAHRDPYDARGPLDIRRLSLGQHGSQLGLEIRTAQKWSPQGLAARPDLSGDDPESYLCLELKQRDNASRWCVTKSGRSKPQLIGGPLNGAGEPTRQRRLRGARVRVHDRSLSAGFQYGRAGLKVGQFRWLALSGWGDPSCAAPPSPKGQPKRRAGPEPEPGTCEDRAPDQGEFNARIRKLRVVGCTRDEDLINRNGSRGKKRIALTFDDGPSQYTDRVIDILNRRHVDGTFFVVGQNIPGESAVLRRMLAGGHEIGNHTMHHETGASAGSLRETSSRIRKATGFEPCTFRPPGGSISSSTSRAAWHQGMSNIIWDVDTNDWQGPGSSTIYSRAVGGANAGSIILMHDGGGNRSATVGALDRIIGKLKHRGYRLVTVTELLNERFIRR